LRPEIKGTTPTLPCGERNARRYCGEVTSPVPSPQETTRSCQGGRRSSFLAASGVVLHSFRFSPELPKATAIPVATLLSRGIPV